MAKLYFRYGAMNCGKTTALLQTAHNYSESGQTAIIIKPAVDTKMKSCVISRLGIKREVDLLVDEKLDLFEYCYDVKCLVSYNILRIIIQSLIVYWWMRCNFLQYIR